MRWVLIGCLSIVVFDVVSAFASVALSIDLLVPGLVISSAIYATSGFMAARETRLARTGAQVGSIVGAADAAVWLVLGLLVGPAPFLPDTSDPAAVIVGMVLAVCIAGLFGLAGGLAARRVTRDQSASL